MHPESCILHPAPPPLSRAEYRELAQLYFWTWRDREGFAQVLDGITLLGIDNDLGVRDPLVDCFLNNIMRADDAEIQRFYDLLGYAITQARALKGDEAYIATLINARFALFRGFSFLVRTDDLKAARVRIRAVKKELERNRAAVIAHDAYKTSSASEVGTSSVSTARQTDPQYIWCEDALMEADWLMKRQRWRAAARAYAGAIGSSTNVSHYVYDGTTMTLAGEIGRLHAAGIVTTNAEFQWDERHRPRSLREWRYCLWCAHQRPVSARLHPVENWIVCSGELPAAYPGLLSYIARTALHYKRAKDAEACVTWLGERWQRKADISPEFYKDWYAACAALGQCSDAYRALHRGLCHVTHALERVALLETCAGAIPWADDDALAVFERCAYAAVVQPMLDNPATGFHGLRNIFMPAQELCTAERELRRCQTTRDLAGVMHALSNILLHTEHAGTLARVAACLADAGQPGAAFAHLWRAYHLRASYAAPFGGDVLTYPVMETPALERWFAAASRDDQTGYLRWFADRIRGADERGNAAVADAMKHSPLYEQALQYCCVTNTIRRQP